MALDYKVKTHVVSNTPLDYGYHLKDADVISWLTNRMNHYIEDNFIRPKNIISLSHSLEHSQDNVNDVVSGTLVLSYYDFDI